MPRPSDLQRTIKPVVIPPSIPNPPSDLSMEEQELWLELFASIEPDWITVAQYPIAKAYVRNVISADRISKMIEFHNTKLAQFNGDFDEDDLKMLTKLTALLDTHHRGILANLRAMRLNNISLRTDKSPVPTATAKPWNVDDEIEAEVIDEKVSEGEKSTDIS